MSLAFEELGNKVEGNVLEREGVFGHGDVVNGGSLLMHEDFVLPAGCTSYDIIH